MHNKHRHSFISFYWPHLQMMNLKICWNWDGAGSVTTHSFPGQVRRKNWPDLIFFYQQNFFSLFWNTFLPLLFMINGGALIFHLHFLGGKIMLSMRTTIYSDVLSHPYFFRSSFTSCDRWLLFVRPYKAPPLSFNLANLSVGVHFAAKQNCFSHSISRNKAF